MNEIRSIDRCRTAFAPAGTRLYAIGDIHGRADLLDRLLAAIETDAATARNVRLVVVFLGDYVDRGDGSRAVIERLLAGPGATGHRLAFQWVCLMGNHERSMLDFLDDAESGIAWLTNGALATIANYVDDGVDGERDIPSFGMRGVQARLRRALPAAHHDFLRRLRPCHQEGDYFFVHAGVRPGISLDAQDPADMMWIRRPFLSCRDDHGKLVVHGHTVVPEPEICSNRIGIDTGAYATGRLTALVAEGDQRWFLST